MKEHAQGQESDRKRKGGKDVRQEKESSTICKKVTNSAGKLTYIFFSKGNEILVID